LSAITYFYMKTSNCI